MYVLTQLIKGIQNRTSDSKLLDIQILEKKILEYPGPRVLEVGKTKIKILQKRSLYNYWKRSLK